MESKSWMSLQAMLNQLHPGAASEALQFLPEEERAAAEESVVSANGLSSFLSKPGDYVQSVHYSWLLASIQESDTSLQPYLMGSLGSKVASRLVKLDNKLPAAVSLTDQGARYFRRYLYTRLLDGQDLLSPDFIPDAPLKGLLEVDKDQLLNLVDYLGLFDLAAQMKDNIDQKLINQIYPLLSEPKQQVFTQLMKRKRMVPVRRPFVGDMDITEKNLMRWLHRGGLLYLADALYGENHSLMWHVLHRFDTGRAELLRKQLQDAEPSEEQKTLALELIDTIRSTLSI